MKRDSIPYWQSLLLRSFRRVLNQQISGCIYRLVHIRMRSRTKRCIQLCSLIIRLFAVHEIDLMHRLWIQLLRLLLLVKKLQLHCRLFYWNSLCPYIRQNTRFYRWRLISMCHLSGPRLIFQHLPLHLYSLINLSQVILTDVLLLPIGHEVKNLLVDLVFELATESEQKLFPLLSNYSVHC